MEPLFPPGSVFDWSAAWWGSHDGPAARHRLDDPNEGGPRECQNEACGRPLPERWPAVYCSSACAAADA